MKQTKKFKTDDKPNYYTAPPEWDEEYEQALKRRGLVRCEWWDEKRKHHVSIEKVDDACWCAATQRYMPKIEFCLRCLGAATVCEFIEQVVERGAISKLLDDEKGLARYRHTREVMVDESRRVEREQLQSAHSGGQFA